VTPPRCDQPRRITPELLAFHKKRAHRLRDEAWRNLWRAKWAWPFIPSFRDGPKDQTRNLEIAGPRCRAPRKDETD
jgi:hypothetical protein